MQDIKLNITSIHIGGSPVNKKSKDLAVCREMFIVPANYSKRFTSPLGFPPEISSAFLGKGVCLVTPLSSDCISTG